MLRCVRVCACVACVSVQSVLPRDNVAAVKIQSVVRMHLAKKVVAAKRVEREAGRLSSESIYGTSYDRLQKSATAIQVPCWSLRVVLWRLLRLCLRCGLLLFCDFVWVVVV